VSHVQTSMWLMARTTPSSIVTSSLGLARSSGKSRPVRGQLVTNSD
jgi:hypothetical protein